MNTEQAYINGFIKRAAEYGLNQNQAEDLLKQSMSHKEEIEQAILKEKLQHAMRKGDASIGMNMAGQTLAPFNHLYNMVKDISEHDSDMPYRTPRISGGAVLGSLAASLPGLIARNPALAGIGSLIGGVTGAGVGTGFYNEAKRKYLRELQDRLNK
jgi:hypothetical protein